MLFFHEGAERADRPCLLACVRVGLPGRFPSASLVRSYAVLGALQSLSCAQAFFLQVPRKGLLHVLPIALLDVVDDLAFGVGLSAELEQAHAVSPPACGLVVLDSQRQLLGVCVRQRDGQLHQRALVIHLGEALLRQGQPHLWLGRVVAEEDAPRNAEV